MARATAVGDTSCVLEPFQNAADIGIFDRYKRQRIRADFLPSSLTTIPDNTNLHQHNRNHHLHSAPHLIRNNKLQSGGILIIIEDVDENRHIRWLRQTARATHHEAPPILGRHGQDNMGHDIDQSIKTRDRPFTAAAAGQRTDRKE